MRRSKTRNPTLPPRWAETLLGWFCNDQQREILEGDLRELYIERIEKHPKLWAQTLFVANVFDCFRPFSLKRQRSYRTNSIGMIKNYWKIAFRNIARQKLYSFINIFGLALGLACFLLIFIYVQDELSYDRQHEASDRIFRVTEKFESEDIGEFSASLPFPTGPTLRSDFPSQVESVVRLFNFQSPTLALANRQLDREYNESRIFFADSTFFDVFDFEMLVGDPGTALDEPNSILITRSMVRKYFGDDDPMGQILEFQGEHNYVVKGVLEDAPLNAHFQFDFLISFPSLKAFYNGGYYPYWYWNPCWTYIKVAENSDPADLEALFPDFVEKYFPEFVREDITLHLQPLVDIHLTSKLDYEIQANSSYENIYIFSGIALFVLLIAAINFINLSTARATNRAKEVGVRKSLGSERSQLITQFIFESIIYVGLAVALAIAMVVITLPQFNLLTEKSISFEILFSPIYLALFSALILGLGILAGFYPAFVLSAFKTVQVLKNKVGRSRGFNFRKVLVTLQFAVSMMLIIGTVMAYLQLQHLQNEDLGFNQEHVLMIPVIRTPMGHHYENFKDESLNDASVISMTAVEEIVGAKHQVANYQFGEMERSKPYPRFNIRHDFVKTFDIPMAAGRTYDETMATDDSIALVVNEELVRSVGWESAEAAIGQDYQFGRVRGKIIGVVQDYNFVSKHHPIRPFVLHINTRARAFNLFIKYVAVRVDGNNMQQAINHLQSTWKQFIPNRPFDYFFLDDRLNDSYATERKLTSVILLFSFMAILVACLGLFGLATHNLETRTKEIGVRKVLGISSKQILVLLSREFALLIAIAFVIAVPLSYQLLEQWLNQFAYRVDIALWPFALSGAVTLAVAMATVGYHALRAARINPVESLRYE